MPSVTQSDWIADAVADLPRIATIKEAAMLLRTTPRNVRRIIAAGRLHVARNRESGSSRVLIPRAEIERYLRGLVAA